MGGIAIGDLRPLYILWYVTGRMDMYGRKVKNSEYAFISVTVNNLNIPNSIPDIFAYQYEV